MEEKTITIGNIVFTLTEFAIIKELMRGLSRKEIAAALNKATATINTHIRAIYLKVGIRKVNAFIAWGFDRGFDKHGNYNPID